MLWFVKDSINEDLWDSDEEIENEEIDDSEDEVFCGDGADDDYELIKKEVNYGRFSNPQEEFTKEPKQFVLLKINQTYINELNRDIASRIVYPEDFVPLTLEEIAQLIYKNEREFEPDSRLIKELDFHVKEKTISILISSVYFSMLGLILMMTFGSMKDIVDEDVDNMVDEVTCAGVGVDIRAS